MNTYILTIPSIFLCSTPDLVPSIPPLNPKIHPTPSHQLGSSRRSCPLASPRRATFLLPITTTSKPPLPNSQPSFPSTTKPLQPTVNPIPLTYSNNVRPRRNPHPPPLRRSKSLPPRLQRLVRLLQLRSPRQRARSSCWVNVSPHQTQFSTNFRTFTLPQPLQLPII